MNSLMGIILTEDKSKHLGALTEKRAISAMPIGGRYRLIDFILSNMVNSDIDQVGIATQYNYQSLMDHIGSGKAWDLNRKNHGLFILPPFVGRENSVSGNGDLDVLYGISNFIHRSSYDYVLLTNGSIMFNINFRDMLKSHIKTGADVTIMYNTEENATSEFLSRHTVIETDKDGFVTDMVKNHHNPKSRKVSMDTYIISRSLLINIIEDCISHGEHDFVLDVLIKGLSRFKINSYEAKGFIGRVDTIESYYATNMKLLDSSVRREIFLSKNKIYTKVKDQVPTHYGDGAVVSDSLIADGCKIEGRVENSIIFRGVQIEKGAVVKNSIIMQNSIIQSNCYIENAVLDKEVIVKAGKTLTGQPSFPFVVPKTSII